MNGVGDRAAEHCVGHVGEDDGCPEGNEMVCFFITIFFFMYFCIAKNQVV